MSVKGTSARQKSSQFAKETRKHAAETKPRLHHAQEYERYRVAKITAISALSTPQTIKLATLLPYVNRCMPEMTSGVSRLQVRTS